ncbi:Opacity-associated protein A LysM-like domain-containing protein [Gallibacterium anatis]|uniref:LysM-like peptidoglycan-binding domain-containing protein n=1 Tax=Gallibacterium anatis TaxID=750 RepID=UPI0005312E99|nr:LysM-like peptidoglycan-binding domain-containing protein [Gallibacterium anatis]KGQ43492.1 Opacity-associated protein A LysM-like domain-containing protein [Gallibacterium anatis]KGQ60491.1 Opacity-associated protein A LysM-like domain-containing protein [Gallibacterium anatis]
MSNTDKEQQSEQQDAKQNELNLEFNEFEPITPKRQAVESAPSFIDKLKGIFNKKAAQAETFQQAEVGQTVENTESNEFTAEPVTAHIKASALANLSTRSRRLLISAAVLVIIIVLFLWLKPNSQPVDSLQSQDNNLPIEFQPIDPNATNANNEGVPTMQTEEQAMDNANDNITDSTTANNNATVTAETLTQNSTASAPSVDNTPITTDENNAAATNQAQTPSITPAPVTPTPGSEQKPALSQAEIDKIEKQAYEAEQARLIAKAKARAEQRAREEFKAKQQKQKEQEQRKAQAILDGKNVPVVDAKPVTRSSSKSTSSTTNVSSGGQAKTLTIPAGTSLMQVFRDNNLNIADVNAMTKANGAGNALSSFKPGDKVAIKVNGGRVSELQLPNGAKFIRQSNGTYIYKK